MIPTERLTTGAWPTRDVHGDDLVVGKVTSLGSVTVTESDIIEFASRWDPLYFHVDAEQARESYYEGLIASGLHTLSLFQRLAVDAEYVSWNVIAGRGIRRLLCPAPVRPGDTLTGTLEILSVRPDDRNRADVLIQGTLLNQRSETALDLQIESLVRMSSR